MRRIKQEVKELCLRFRNADTESEEFKKLQNLLENKYKFTPFNLLALFYNPPTIEYNDENFSLVTEEVSEE